MPHLGTRERELLLACGRLTLDPPRRDRVEGLLRESLDWSAILWYARLHSVAPLLHRHVSQMEGRESPPAKAVHGLLRLYHRAAYQNRHFAREHALVADAFYAAGVGLLVPKGLSLLEGIYGSLAMRPLVDLIFLVRRNARRLAEGALRDLGYRLKRPHLVDGVYRWSSPHSFFVKPGSVRTVILLQWDIVSWPRLNGLALGGVWRRARPAVVAGRECLFPSAVDLVLYLCLQADNHGHFNRLDRNDISAADLLFAPWSNNRLIRFTDLYEAIRHEGAHLDWDLLVERALKTGTDEAAYASLRLTEELLGPLAPPGVLERLRTSQRHRLRRWLLASLAAPAARSRLLEPLRRATRAGWLRLGGWEQLRAARVIALVEYGFPPVQQLRRAYTIRSPSAIPAAYLWHAARTVVRSATAFAGLAFAHTADAARARVPLPRGTGSPPGAARPLAIRAPASDAPPEPPAATPGAAEANRAPA